MIARRQHSILRYGRRAFDASTAARISDAELLRRFVDQRDEAAFELLMWRHAAMVLHVCRQVLGDEYSAEDAFQATFLVLLRKADSINCYEALASWLYRVALHIALKTRAEKRKRSSVEQELNGQDAPAAADNALEREQLRMIAEEVQHLPEKYRLPIVACYFEAKTLEEAAQQLRWPRGTVASRLARGRELLRYRLIRRGVAYSESTLTSPVHADIPSDCSNIGHEANGFMRMV